MFNLPVIFCNLFRQWLRFFFVGEQCDEFELCNYINIILTFSIKLSQGTQYFTRLLPFTIIMFLNTPILNLGSSSHGDWAVKINMDKENCHCFYKRITYLSYFLSRIFLHEMFFFFKAFLMKQIFLPIFFQLLDLCVACG